MIAVENSVPDFVVLYADGEKETCRYWRFRQNFYPDSNAGAMVPGRVCGVLGFPPRTKFNRETFVRSLFIPEKEGRDTYLLSTKTNLGFAPSAFGIVVLWSVRANTLHATHVLPNFVISYYNFYKILFLRVYESTHSGKCVYMNKIR